MAKLSLYFAGGGKSLALYETSFEAESLDDPLHCLRSQTLQAGGRGNFRWSSAVRALAVLFVRARSLQCLSADISEEPLLQGTAQSLAASLDYAISKQPNWILDMFGVDRHGRSFLRKLLVRVNPERKRPGPVQLFLSPWAKSNLTIEVSVNSLKVEAKESLDAIAQLIEEGDSDTLDSRKINSKRDINFSEHLRAFSEKTSTSTAALPSDVAQDHTPPLPPAPALHAYLHHEKLKGPLSAPFSEVSWHDWLFSIYRDEVRHALADTEIFVQQKQSLRIQQLLDNPSFQQLTGGEVPLVSEMDFNLSSSYRFGVIEDKEALRSELCADQPIRFVISPAHASTFAIVQYLKLVKGYHIELSFQYAHSVEMVGHALNESFAELPDICSLTIATVATLLRERKRSAYQPYLLMPKISHGILTPSISSSKKRTAQDGCYLFMSQIPATESFYYDKLRRDGYLHSPNTTSMHMEPDEVTASMSTGERDLRAIIAFPHYQFNHVFNNCSLLNKPYANDSMLETVCVAHRSFLQNHRRTLLLDVAIRDAWLELRENSTLCEAIVHTIVENRDYIRCLKRITGLHNLSGSCALPPQQTFERQVANE